MFICKSDKEYFVMKSRSKQYILIALAVLVATANAARFGARRSEEDNEYLDELDNILEENRRVLVAINEENNRESKEEDNEFVLEAERVMAENTLDTTEINVSHMCSDKKENDECDPNLLHKCQQKRHLLCRSNGICQKSTNVTNNNSCCYDLTCPKSSIVTTKCDHECKDENNVCKGVPNELCPSSMNSSCLNLGCCHLSTCESEESHSWLVQTNFCNRTLCPKLTQACWEGQGWCNIRPTCKNENCYCAVEVGCQEKQGEMRTFDIHYEIDDEAMQNLEESKDNNEERVGSKEKERSTEMSEEDSYDVSDKSGEQYGKNDKKEEFGAMKKNRMEMSESGEIGRQNSFEEDNGGKNKVDKEEVVISEEGGEISEENINIDGNEANEVENPTETASKMIDEQIDKEDILAEERENIDNLSTNNVDRSLQISVEETNVGNQNLGEDIINHEEKNRDKFDKSIKTEVESSKETMSDLRSASIVDEPISTNETNIVTSSTTTSTTKIANAFTKTKEEEKSLESSLEPTAEPPKVEESKEMGTEVAGKEESGSTEEESPNAYGYDENWLTTKTSTVSGVTKASTVSGVTKTSPVSGIKKTSTVSVVTKTSTVSGITKASTVSGVTKLSTVSGVTKASTVSGVTKASTVSVVTKVSEESMSKLIESFEEQLSSSGEEPLDDHGQADQQEAHLEGGEIEESTVNTESTTSIPATTILDKESGILSSVEINSDEQKSSELATVITIVNNVSLAKDTFDKQCISSPSSPFKANQTLIRTLEKELLKLAMARFDVNNVHECSPNQVCNLLNVSHTCNNSATPHCHTFGTCDSNEKCFCTVNLHCESLEPMPKHVNRLLKLDGMGTTKKFRVTKKQECNEKRVCSHLSTKCNNDDSNQSRKQDSNKPQCHTRLECIGSKCVCTINAFCNNKDKKDNKNEKKDEDKEELHKAQFQLETGQAKSLSLHLLNIKLCEPKAICPTQSRVKCNNGKPNCKARLDCKHLMCIVDLECPESSNSTSNTTTKVISASDDCLASVCQPLALVNSACNKREHCGLKQVCNEMNECHEECHVSQICSDAMASSDRKEEPASEPELAAERVQAKSELAHFNASAIVDRFLANKKRSVSVVVDEPSDCKENLCSHLGAACKRVGVCWTQLQCTFSHYTYRECLCHFNINCGPAPKNITKEPYDPNKTFSVEDENVDCQDRFCECPRCFATLWCREDECVCEIDNEQCPKQRGVIRIEADRNTEEKNAVNFVDNTTNNDINDKSTTETPIELGSEGRLNNATNEEVQEEADLASDNVTTNFVPDTINKVDNTLTTFAPKTKIGEESTEMAENLNENENETSKLSSTSNNRIILAQEVNVRFVVRGLIKPELSPKVSLECSREELCPRTNVVCGDQSNALCMVTEANNCNDDECVCNVHSVCPKVHYQRAGPRSLDQKAEKRQGITDGRDLDKLNYQMLVSKDDLERSGLDLCLQSCYEFGANCSSAQACQLDVDCFLDHCVCHMGLKCASSSPKENVDNNESVGNEEETQNESQENRDDELKINWKMIQEKESHELKHAYLDSKQTPEHGPRVETSDAEKLAEQMSSPRSSTWLRISRSGPRICAILAKRVCPKRKFCPGQKRKRVKCRALTLNCENKECDCVLALECPEQDDLEEVRHFRVKANELFDESSRLSKCNRMCSLVESVANEDDAECIRCHARIRLHKENQVKCKLAKRPCKQN